MYLAKWYYTKCGVQEAPTPSKLYLTGRGGMRVKAGDSRARVPVTKPENGALVASIVGGLEKPYIQRP